MLLGIVLFVAVLICGSQAKSSAHIESLQPQADMIDVHLICHTHDDVGWLKTVDEYFLGANNTIQNAGVQYVLDSVVQELAKDPNKKFIYVEIAFFSRWWSEQTPEIQALTKKLVANGQLEFINGGWCMNDEATTHYVDIVDQMARGHAFLKETFGVTPTIGWHIDPFGHSAVQAEMFANMGFDGFFFARIDYDDKRHRLADREMEMVWRGSPSLGKSAEIFTSVLMNGYGPPPTFCFDVFCSDTPINDDPNLFNNNIASRAKDFANYAKMQNTHYRSGNVMLTMGNDFQYQSANHWYKNLDKLINYIQKHPELGVNVFYSTPSQYLKAVHAKNLTWSVKTDDFFPYADCPHCFWTGYFTSRPALKGYVREMSSYLQTCRHFEFFAKVIGIPTSTSSQYLWHAMGVAQHHDAVSGTEKQHVAYDYAERLSIGESQCRTLINDVLALFVSNSTAPPVLSQCPLLNTSLCDNTQTMKAGDGLVVLIYNPSGHNRTEYIRLPVSNVLSYTVKGANGSIIPSQVVNNVALRPGAASHSLVFTIDAPAIGINTYFVQAAAASSMGKTTGERQAEAQSITNGQITVNFNANNLISSVTANGRTLPLVQELLWYNSSTGNNVNSSQASGAYIFRPNSTHALLIDSTPSISVQTGDVVQEATQVFADWAQQTVRLYQGAPYIEIEYQIGPIPIDDGLGKEIITRFSTPLNTNKTCYTDSNGREMRTRVRNYRATWVYNDTEAVSGNYYPVNSAAFIEDAAEKMRLTVLTDRSCAGASLDNGELELMIHRRLLHDDNRGVGEALNESGITGEGLVIRTKQYVFVSDPDTSAGLQRKYAEQLDTRALVAFTDLPSTPSEWASKHYTRHAAIYGSLPFNVHLETVQWLADNQILIRLSHMFEVNESVEYSQPVKVALNNIFHHDIAMKSATELSLSANQDLSNIDRLKWNTNSTANESGYKRVPLNGFDVVLQPMEIRTFLLHYQH